MWDPKLSFLAPSYAYAPGSEQNPNALDGELWAGQFEWDQSFAAYMLGMDALGLALSQIVALVKTKTAVRQLRHTFGPISHVVFSPRHPPRAG